MRKNYPTPNTVQGAKLLGTWTGAKIPVYGATTAHDLNQLVGYVKHINASNGTVLYRGQCDLNESLKPSILRAKKDLSDKDKKLKETIEEIINDHDIINFFHFYDDVDVSEWKKYQELIVEATLQHYWASTYCIDFVDNHWSALWFGLYRWDFEEKQYKKRENIPFDRQCKNICFDPNYLKIQDLPERPKKKTMAEIPRRVMKTIEANAEKTSRISKEELCEIFLNKEVNGRLKKWESKCLKINEKNAKNQESSALEDSCEYMFLLLYLADTNAPHIRGMYLGEDTYTIDLRKALPSTFLRPSSQHGWIVRGKDELNFNFENRMVCVIRLSIELVSDMLGDGFLLSQRNFFPSYSIDQGYRVLLSRQIGSGISSGCLKKIIPKDMVLQMKD